MCHGPTSPSTAPGTSLRQCHCVDFGARRLTLMSTVRKLSTTRMEPRTSLRTRPRRHVECGARPRPLTDHTPGTTHIRRRIWMPALCCWRCRCSCRSRCARRRGWRDGTGSSVLAPSLRRCLHGLCHS